MPPARLGCEWQSPGRFTELLLCTCPLLTEAAPYNPHLPSQGTCVLSPQLAMGTWLWGSKSPQACYSIGLLVSYPLSRFPISPLPPSFCSKLGAPQPRRARHSQVVT